MLLIVLSEFWSYFFGLSGYELEKWKYDCMACLCVNMYLKVRENKDREDD